MLSNSLFPISSNYLCSDVFSFTSTWKMVKYALNYGPMNMIALSHTSRKILKDSDVLISPVVLITPKALRYMTVPLWYHISTFCAEVTTICI